MRSIKGVFLVYLLFTINYKFANSQKDKRIIIVGAGPSGIAAASRLFENGFTNITLLEAENRIGGRVYTTKIGNYSVDLGGQWVHGEKDNTVFNMAYPLGLLETSNASIINIMLLDSSGNFLNSDANKKFLMFFNKYHVQGEIIENNSSTKSLGASIEEVFEKELGDVPEIMSNKKHYLHYLEVFALSLDPATSWYDLPAAGDDDFHENEGDKHVNWKTRAYGTILDILMKRYPNPAKELPIMNNTYLNSEVTLVDYSNSKSDDSIKVTLKDGKIVEADHVIATVSLGVLKNDHRSLFTPLLPERKIKAIEGISFGGGGKIFMLFDKPFWQADVKQGTYYGFFWNETEREALKQDPEKIWILGITGAEPVAHKPNLLELYITGDYAISMEAVSEEKVFNESSKLIERFMGKAYNFSQPSSMLRTQWHTNPHFRGTYSYHGIETKTKNVRPKMLEEPLTADNLKILFAGEATFSHRFGTVDGAIETGYSAANRLINYYNKESSEE